MWIDRRRVLWTAATVATVGAMRPMATFAAGDPIEEVVAGLEKRLGARIGVAVIDDHGGRAWNHRAAERFAFCSTFKAYAAAALLARVDRGEERLDRRIVFAASDLVTYSPTTEKRVGEPGMTLAEIAEAAVTLSDNTAANLILDAIGGPQGLTTFLRSLGDDVGRLDRRETQLNEAKPGDPRDTTTPSAAAHTLHELVVGRVLTPASREQLTAWLVGDRVGDALLRAGLPKNWTIADKTGAGGNGARGIVAVAWPPGRKPVTIAIYIAETAAAMADRNAAIAAIGAAIARSLG
ncbi:class A beta-lactamase [Pinisolibacter sp.]|mgnify:FL=1|uniref:class A beta-lactamase n=1 Tax=Pinisolibacter sp. TaxID=2172024 RepID=UPI003FA6CA5C